MSQRAYFLIFNVVLPVWRAIFVGRIVETAFISQVVTVCWTSNNWVSHAILCLVWLFILFKKIITVNWLTTELLFMVYFLAHKRCTDIGIFKKILGIKKTNVMEILFSENNGFKCNGNKPVFILINQFLNLRLTNLIWWKVYENTNTSEVILFGFSSDRSVFSLFYVC